MVSLTTILDAAADVSDAESVSSGYDKILKDKVISHTKTSLWRKAKFTTAATARYKTGDIYVMMVNEITMPEDMGEKKWEYYESKIRKTLNTKRNNTVDAMKKDFIGKCGRLTCVRAQLWVWQWSTL